MTIVGAASRDDVVAEVLDGGVAILFDGRTKAFPVPTEKRAAAAAKANVRNMMLEGCGS